MKIKTILEESITAFDAAVNEALAQGWTLVKRDVLAPYVAQTAPHETSVWPRFYYAELELVPCCDNCKHEARDPDDPSTPCHRCENDEMWEARG